MSPHRSGCHRSGSARTRRSSSAVARGTNPKPLAAARAVRLGGGQGDRAAAGAEHAAQADVWEHVPVGAHGREDDVHEDRLLWALRGPYARGGVEAARGVARPSHSIAGREALLPLAPPNHLAMAKWPCQVCAMNSQGNADEMIRRPRPGTKQEHAGDAAHPGGNAILDAGRMDTNRVGQG